MSLPAPGRGSYLVSGKVLLVAGAAAQDSQAVLTQQVFGFSVKLLEVLPDLRVERGPEVTHLQQRETHTRKPGFL